MPDSPFTQIKWLVVVRPDDPDSTSVGWVDAEDAQAALEKFVGGPNALGLGNVAYVVGASHVRHFTNEPTFVEVREDD